jgi:hypothetical protein
LPDGFYMLIFNNGTEKQYQKFIIAKI